MLKLKLSSNAKQNRVDRHDQNTHMNRECEVQVESLQIIQQNLI